MSNPAGLAEHLSAGTKNPWIRTRHLEYISHILADASFTGYRFIILTEPPRTGKTELGSHWFPVWYLNLWPDRQILTGSYEAEFAARQSRRVRNTITENADFLDVQIASDSRAKHRWHTTEGGGLYSAGVGGPLTGMGANLLILDDLFKNHQQANSAVYRDTVWNWFISTAFTRLEPGGVCIILTTRWHEDDLVGRILAAQKEDTEGIGVTWELINLPAIAEENDAIGRRQGEALWPERFPLEALYQIRKQIGSYHWAGMYQQRPAPSEGTMFKMKDCREWVRTVTGFFELCDETGHIFKRVPVSKCTLFGTVDLAISEKQTADYTVIAAWACTPDHDLILMDVARDRFGVDNEAAIRNMSAKHNLSFMSVESVGFQLSSIQKLRRGDRRRRIPPLSVREFRPKGPKIERARQAQVFMEGGMVFFPRGKVWRDDWDTEIFRFPASKHDDQVDTLSMAVIEVESGKVRGPGAAKISVDRTPNPLRL